jgi:hypothetical protein
VLLWLKSRRVVVVAAIGLLSLAAMAWPGSGIQVTSSPVGASLAAACFLALAAPVLGAWANGQGEPVREWVSIRHVKRLDLVLMVGLVAGLAATAVVAHAYGIAPAGDVAGRAMLTYLGMVLIACPVVGWRRAALLPTIYLLTVAVLGRGDDSGHPAIWAWIAADGVDSGAWWLSLGVLALGVLAYTLAPWSGPLAVDE